MTVSTVKWATLGSISPLQLISARLELTWAVQALDAVGRTLATPESDFSHIALRWDEQIDGLTTVPVHDGVRAGLNLDRGELAIIAGDDTVTATSPLAGKTLVEAAEWVREGIAAGLPEEPDWTPIREDLEISPVANGAPFSAPTVAHVELARWYRNAVHLFRSVRETEADAGPILCWPHHLDVATFINLDPELAQYEGRSINVGMSPGDEKLPEPYFYVVPYPTVGPNGLPVLEAGGFWQTDGWVGAVLNAASVVSTGQDTQGQAVEAFVRSALNGSKRLLGAD